MRGILTYMVSSVAKKLEADMPALLEGTQLNTTAYRILACLDYRGALSISDLGRVMNIDRAQISRATAALEQDGLIAFQPHRTNRRKKMVVLTNDGNAALIDASPRIVERRRRLEDALGPERLQDLLTSLQILSRELDS